MARKTAVPSAKTTSTLVRTAASIVKAPVTITKVTAPIAKNTVRSAKTSASALQTPATIAETITSAMKFTAPLLQQVRSQDLLTDETLDRFCESVAAPPTLALSVFWKDCIGRACRRCLTALFGSLAPSARWLMPLNVGQHWVLFVILWRQGAVVFCNSLGCWPSQDDVRSVQLVMTAAAPELQWERWRLIVPETPQQDDSWSCGYRVCWLAEVASTGQSRPFSIGRIKDSICSRIQVLFHVAYE